MSESAQNSPSTTPAGNAKPFFPPKPYLFSKQDRNNAIIDISPDECKRENVQCPAFNVLLDHTIAVLWICYSALPPGAAAAEQPITGPDRVQLLTTGQLEWAVQFLKSIRNADGGEQSLDVRTAIDHLQDLVFNKYADAAVPHRTSSATMMGTRVDIGGDGGGGHLMKACQSLPSVVDSLATESTDSLMSGSSMSVTLDVILSRCIPKRLGQLLGRGNPALRPS